MNISHFDTLAEHSPVKNEKYADSLSMLIKEFKNRFQDFQRSLKFFGIFMTPFSFDTNKIPVNFQMKGIGL